METPGKDLDGGKGDEDGREDECRGEIAEAHVHADEIAADFAKRRGKDFHDPEGGSGSRHLAEEVAFFGRQSCHPNHLQS